MDRPAKFGGGGVGGWDQGWDPPLSNREPVRTPVNIGDYDFQTVRKPCGWVANRAVGGGRLLMVDPPPSAALRRAGG